MVCFHLSSYNFFISQFCSFLGKDSHHVFFMGQLIVHAHAFSFEVLNKGYAKDRNYVFQNGQIIKGVKPFGFQSP